MILSGRQHPQSTFRCVGRISGGQCCCKREGVEHGTPRCRAHLALQWLGVQRRTALVDGINGAVGTARSDRRRYIVRRVYSEPFE